jgi:cell division protein FtsB
MSDKLNELISAANAENSMSAYIIKATGVIGLMGVLGAIGYLAYTKASITLAVTASLALVATLCGFAVNWSSIVDVRQFKDAILAMQAKMGQQAKEISNLNATADALVQEKKKLMEDQALAEKAHAETAKIAQDAVDALKAEKAASAKLASDKVAADAAKLEAEARAVEARKNAVRFASENQALRAQLDALQGKKVEKAVEIAKERRVAPSAGAGV